MSSIGALCDRLGMTFLKFLLGNLGATGGLRVNSSPAYNLSFVPADESAILPMTAKEACEGGLTHYDPAGAPWSNGNSTNRVIGPLYLDCFLTT